MCGERRVLRILRVSVPMVSRDDVDPAVAIDVEQGGGLLRLAHRADEALDPIVRPAILVPVEVVADAAGRAGRGDRVVEVAVPVEVGQRHRMEPVFGRHRRADEVVLEVEQGRRSRVASEPAIPAGELPTCRNGDNGRTDLHREILVPVGPDLGIGVPRADVAERLAGPDDDAAVQEVADARKVYGMVGVEFPPRGGRGVVRDDAGPVQLAVGAHSLPLATVLPDAELELAGGMRRLTENLEAGVNLPVLVVVRPRPVLRRLCRRHEPLEPVQPLIKREDLVEDQKFGCLGRAGQGEGQ